MLRKRIPEFTPEQKEAMRKRYTKPRQPPVTALPADGDREAYANWVAAILADIRAERARRARLAAGGIW